MVQPPTSGQKAWPNKADSGDSASAVLKNNQWFVGEEEQPPQPRRGSQGSHRHDLAGSAPHPGSAAQHPASPDAAKQRSAENLDLFAGCPSLAYLVPTFISLACIIAGAVILGILGTGEEAGFRCDYAVIGLCGSTALFFLLLLCVELCGRGGLSRARLYGPVQIVLAVNGFGLLSLALLAHATWAIVQVFAVVAASSWTLVCTSAAAHFWRRGIPAPVTGENNLVRVLLDAPKITALVSWVVFVALGYSMMYFKPMDQAGFSDQIGRMEHFLLLSLGGIVISSILTWLALSIHPRGQRLLLFPDERRTHVGFLQLQLRAFVVAIGSHFLAAVIIAFAFNWVIVCLCIGLAQCAIRNARPPDKANLNEDPSVKRRGRFRKQTCSEKAKDGVLTLLFLLFGFLRVVAIFMVFFFDVTFIQSYMIGTTQRDFVLAGQDLACGVRDALVTNEAEDIARCTKKAVEEQGAAAFIYGTRGSVAGQCYSQTLEVSFDDYSVYRTGIAQVNQSCPGGQGSWQDTSGFDFYVVAPRCRLVSRRLDELTGDRQLEDKTEDQLTFYDFRFPFYVGEAAKNVFGQWSKVLVDGYTEFLRTVMEFGNLTIPTEFNIRCTGIRRLISASMVFGAIMIVVTLTSMDLLSIMAASNEIAKIRAARTESFVDYLVIVTCAALLQQLVLLILQVSISWGAKLVWETAGIFALPCGYLVKDGHLALTACPNFWHVPVDSLASGLLFLSILLGLMTFLAVMSGSLYGLLPARWAVKALFGKELRVVLMDQRGEERPGADEKDFHTRKPNLLLRPFIGVGVSIGLWFTSACQNYRCGNRQDWYEPLSASDAESDDPRAIGKSELVDFKCMYEATAHNISLVWLPVPFLGAIMSKGTMYLNNYVIFAFGLDGGGTDRKPQRMISHFQEDSPRLVHILHWASNAMLFFMVVAINCDFFGVQETARLAVLSVCLVAVLIIAIARVVVDLIKEVRVFQQGKHLLKSCRSLVEDDSVYQEGVILRMAKVARGLHTDGTSTDNPLEELPSCERQHLKRAEKACEELADLPWVKSKRLPQDVMSRLVSPKSRLGGQGRSLERLIEEADGDPSLQAVVMAGTILYMHQAVYHEICAHRSQIAARERAFFLANEAACAAGKELEQLAAAEACAQAAAIATARMAQYQEAKDSAAEQRRQRPRNEQVFEPMEPPCRLSLEFEACSKGIARVAAHFREEHGGRQLIDPQQAEVSVMVSGKVEMSWPQGKDINTFSANDAQVKAVRHQIVGRPDPEADIEVEDLVDMAAPQPLPSRSSFKAVSSEKEWLCSLCVHEDSSQSCQCLRLSTGKRTRFGIASSDVQSWVLDDLGVAWDTADAPGGVAAAAVGQGPDDLQMLQGKQATSSFRVVSIFPPPMQYLPQIPAQAGAAPEESQDVVDLLETALRDSVNNPQTLALASAFMSALGSDRQHMGAEQAERCSRLMAVASRILRTQKRTSSRNGSRPTSREQMGHRASDIAIDLTESKASFFPASSSGFSQTTEAPLEMRISALEVLREALARDDLSSDELSIAIDRARRADVDPLILAKAEDRFRSLIRKQRAALTLARAIESRMIQQLRQGILDAQAAGMKPDDHPDRTGVGVLRKAKDVLQEEESNALDAMKAAIRSGGALQLRRAIEQAGALGSGGVSVSEAEVNELVNEAESKLTSVAEKKRLIALLKMAMTSGNAGLLKAAVEECEQSDAEGVSLDQAKKRLETLQMASGKFQEGLEVQQMDPRRPPHHAEMEEVLPGGNRAYRQPASTGSTARPESNDTEQARALASLRAALYQDPPEMQMLRLAVQQAKQVGVTGLDLDRAGEVLLSLADQESALEGVRKAVAARDVGDLLAAISLCYEIRVDRRKLLTAVQQLMDEQAKVARIAGDHGLGSLVLADLEHERRQLHNSLLESYGGLRSLCRVRPETANDLPYQKSRNAPPLYQRSNRHTLLVAGEGSRPRPVAFGAVFGAECIQAEVFNDIRGLAQSAVDGYNVLIMAGGPPGAGKTFTMMGEATEHRGIAPRMIDEIFQIRERDSWRANLEVDTQVVEVVDTRKMGDLLGRGVGRMGAGPSVRLVPQGVAARGLSDEDDAELVAVDGAVTRRAASKHELKRMIQESYQNRAANGRPSHHVILITLTRTNRATGAMTRSKLALADLAGLAPVLQPEAAAAYKALENVFKALARGDRRPPYRDHALTQVLQDCMGGSAKTVLLLALPPAECTPNRADCIAAMAFATCASW